MARTSERPAALGAAVVPRHRAQDHGTAARAPGAIRTRDTRFRRAVLYPLSYEGLRGATLPGEHGPLEPGAARARRGSAVDPAGRARRRGLRPGWGPAQARPQGVPLLRSDGEASSRLRAGTTITGQAAWDRTP